MLGLNTLRCVSNIFDQRKLKNSSVAGKIWKTRQLFLPFSAGIKVQAHLIENYPKRDVFQKVLRKMKRTFGLNQNHHQGCLMKTMQDGQWPVEIALIWEESWKSWRWNCHFWLNKKVTLKRKGVSWKPKYKNWKKDSLLPRTAENKMFSSHSLVFIQLNLTFFSNFKILVRMLVIWNTMSLQRMGLMNWRK